jgi:hypothetical protein
MHIQSYLRARWFTENETRLFPLSSWKIQMDWKVSSGSLIAGLEMLIKGSEHAGNFHLWAARYIIIAEHVGIQLLLITIDTSLGSGRLLHFISSIAGVVRSVRRKPYY